MTSGQLRTGSRKQRLTRRLVWLAVEAEIMRSRRLQDQVIVGAILLAALAGLGREMRARTLARARAWDRRLDRRTTDAARESNPHG